MASLLSLSSRLRLLSPSKVKGATSIQGCSRFVHHDLKLHLRGLPINMTTERFGDRIGVDSAVTSKVTKLDAKTFDLDYLVTQDRCTGTSKPSGEKFFAGSAILGLFDHYSTYVVAEADRTCRPGVSISLAADFMPNWTNHTKPGSQLTIRCSASKVGKAIAFADCSVICQSTNQTIAQLRHVKYMPMGWWWDMLFNPKVAHITTAAITKFGGYFSKGAKPSKTSFQELVHLKSNGDFGPLEPGHTNPLGGFHGGCQAIISEAACLHVLDSIAPSSAFELESIQMTYYRGAVKGKVVAEAEKMWKSDREPLDSSITLTSSIKSTKGVLSEGVFSFKQTS